MNSATPLQNLTGAMVIPGTPPLSTSAGLQAVFTLSPDQIWVLGAETSYTPIRVHGRFALVNDDYQNDDPKTHWRLFMLSDTADLDAPIEPARMQELAAVTINTENPDGTELRFHVIDQTRGNILTERSIVIKSDRRVEGSFFRHSVVRVGEATVPVIAVGMLTDTLAPIVAGKRLVLADSGYGLRVFTDNETVIDAPITTTSLQEVRGVYAYVTRSKLGLSGSIGGWRQTPPEVNRCNVIEVEMGANARILVDGKVRAMAIVTINEQSLVRPGQPTNVFPNQPTANSFKAAPIIQFRGGLQAAVEARGSRLNFGAAVEGYVPQRSVVASFELNMERYGHLIPTHPEGNLTSNFVIVKDGDTFQLYGFPNGQLVPVWLKAVVSSATEGFWINTEVDSTVGFAVKPHRDYGAGYYTTDFVEEDTTAHPLDPQVLVDWAAAVHSRQPALFKQIVKRIGYDMGDGSKPVRAHLQDIRLTLAIVTSAMAALKGLDIIDSLTSDMCSLVVADYNEHRTK